MAKWIKLKVRMQNLSELEEAQRLDLPKPQISETFNDVVIDLEAVIAYCPSYDEDGNATELSELALIAGGTVVVGKTFEELDRLIRSS